MGEIGSGEQSKIIDQSILSPVTPIEQTSFWNLEGLLPEDDEKRFPEFMDKVQKESTLQVPKMSHAIAGFFSVPTEYIADTTPPVYVHDSIAGGSPKHRGKDNTILMPIGYAFAHYIGQTDDLRETQLHPGLAHEIGHYVQMAAITKGDPSKFEAAYHQHNRIAFELFARLSERIICDDMNINLKHAQRTDFAPADEHIGMALADEQYQKIKDLPPQERQRLALDIDQLMQYIDPQVITDHAKSVEAAQIKFMQRRRMRRR
jgi:hypothetical protein